MQSCWINASNHQAIGHSQLHSLATFTNFVLGSKVYNACCSAVNLESTVLKFQQEPVERLYSLKLSAWFLSQVCISVKTLYFFFTGQWLNLFYGTLTAAVAPANERLLQHTNHKLMFYDETKQKKIVHLYRNKKQRIWDDSHGEPSHIQVQFLVGSPTPWVFPMTGWWIHSIYDRTEKMPGQVCW